MLISTDDTKISKATATVTFNDVLSTYSSNGSYKRYAVITDLEIPALSSILKVRGELKDSFNVSTGGQNRTRLRVYNEDDGTEFFKMNTSHKRDVYDVKNLYKAPVYTGDTAYEISMELECFLDGVWSTQSYTLTGVRGQTTGVGTDPDATLIFGGEDEHGLKLATGLLSNGTSWSAVVAAFPSSKYVSQLNMCGTTTATLFAGGTLANSAAANGSRYTTTCWTYNGTSFTSTGAMATKREGAALSGTTSNAMIVGGDLNISYSLAEVFGGATWSSQSNNFPFGAKRPRSVGTGNNALIVGGASFDYETKDYVYEWNDVTFALDSLLNIRRFNCGLAGAYSAGFTAFVYGGWTGNTITGTSGGSISECETYDATANVWRTSPSMLRKDSGQASSGTSTNALSAGGVSGFVAPLVYEIPGGSPANLNLLQSGEVNFYIDYITYS